VGVGANLPKYKKITWHASFYVVSIIICKDLLRVE